MKVVGRVTAGSGGRQGDRNRERQSTGRGATEENRASEGTGGERKSESLSSAAEMSDLVCRCRALSEARAVITRALFTHTDTHSVESFFATRRTFAEIFFVLPLFSLYIKLINCSPELPAAPLWSQLSLLRLPLPGKHQRCTLWPIVERGGEGQQDVRDRQ